MAQRLDGGRASKGRESGQQLEKIGLTRTSSKERACSSKRKRTWLERVSLKVRQGEEWLQNMNGEEQLDRATETEAEKEKKQRMRETS